MARSEQKALNCLVKVVIDETLTKIGAKTLFPLLKFTRMSQAIQIRRSCDYQHELILFIGVKLWWQGKWRMNIVLI